MRTVEGRVVQTVPVDLAVLSLQAIQPTSYFLGVEAGGRALGRPTLSVSSGDTVFDTAAYTWKLTQALLMGCLQVFLKFEFTLRVFEPDFI